MADAHPGVVAVPWYKDAIVYQLHVRAFCDGNGDGIGDFRGLTSKLDYLQDLGVTALWLQPFYPSPLRDDGYDIAAYCDVHPSYGTLRDVEVFLREAHARGLRVITELVINHTSDQHPWFQRARRAKPGSVFRDFYVWSDTPDRYADTRIIFKDFEPSNWTWDPVAGAYYWHRFYAHQPDLNFDNPAVHKAVFQALDFWLRLGVDGLRLDAIPYLFEREGTNCENLPETHAFLKTLRRHVDEHFADRMLLAEANQWPEDAVAYFGDGDECHMSFHFPVMPRLFMALHMEDRFPIIDILEQTPAIPATSQWAMFLRNHDELTLEMVTDEERDYMYRVYAADPQARINLGIRRRLSPLLGNDRRRIELLNGLLMALPGTPIVYYGDEIGMGDNIYLGDRNGVRTPMQWNADRNAGFSKADPQRLYLPVVQSPEHSPTAINVETQQNNPHSLLWWMKRLIALRRRHPAFGRAPIEFLHPENRKVLAFLRCTDDERILVVVNLSRFVQHVELDLRRFRGLAPVEMFGQNEFPPIGDLPYLLSLGPHSFYWFTLETPRSAEHRLRSSRIEEPLPCLRYDRRWEELLEGPPRRALEAALPSYLRRARWFGGKARHIKQTRLVDDVAVTHDGFAARMLFVEVEYNDAEPETYVVPLAYAPAAEADALRSWRAHAVVVELQDGEGRAAGILHEAVWEPSFGAALFEALRRNRRIDGRNGRIVAEAERGLRASRGDDDARHVVPLRVDQSNSSMAIGAHWHLKLFRHVEAGINPDLEIGRFLSRRTSFAHAPRVAGAILYERDGQPAATLALLQEQVTNEGDAWRYTLDVLARFYDDVATDVGAIERLPWPGTSWSRAARQPIPEAVLRLVGSYVAPARQLGEIIATLHGALASDVDDADFRPEPFSTLYQRSLYQAWRASTRLSLDALRRELPRLDDAARALGEAVLPREAALDAAFRRIVTEKLGGERTRIHGDLHLGQILRTGRDFVVLDFEGEPARSLSERRLKRSPLRDVAGMLRSFHYAAHAQLRERRETRATEDRRLRVWARWWWRWAAVAFLQGYFAKAEASSFLPADDGERDLLLDLFLVDKALYELRYELQHRPTWAAVPLAGLLDLLGIEDDGR